MKRQWIRTLSLSLAVLFTASSLAACGSANTGSSATPTPDSSSPTASATPEATPEATPLPAANLVWYVVGDAHKDQAMVDEAINEKLKADLNTNLKLNFTTWNEWQSKYNLLLVSGESIDMIFASTWADFSKYAKMGAFKDLTELIPNYAPQTWANVPTDDWESATFDGKILAVPCTNPEFTPAGWFYREDLRKAYNLPEITDMASLEAYLAGIKANNSSITPIVGINEISSLFVWSNKFEHVGGRESDLVKIRSYDSPRDLILYPFTDEFEQFVKMTKEWADKGYWSKDILSANVTPSDALKAGKAAAAWMNPGTAYGIFNNFITEHPDWEGGYFPFSRLKGYTVANSPMNNGMAIPISASNPERSLMVLDLFRNDPDYYGLYQWGIPDYHWSLTADGKNKVVPAEGQDQTVNQGFWTTSWGWTNYKLNIESTNVYPGKADYEKEFLSMQRPDIFSQIKIDEESVKTEKAGIDQVNSKYVSILLMGLATDVDKTLAEYRDQLKKAGVEKYFEEMKKQIYQYYDEKGIQ